VLGTEGTKGTEGTGSTEGTEKRGVLVKLV
jgi:hypothetical protein